MPTGTPPHEPRMPFILPLTANRYDRALRSRLRHMEPVIPTATVWQDFPLASIHSETRASHELQNEIPHMPNERDLYPHVVAFLQKEFSCISTKVNTGTRYAHIDVLGLRERRSDFATSTELLAVEVKQGGTRLLNFIGQALAYSLYANRIYLAWQKKNGQSITKEEIDISSKFGVGLLHISKTAKISLISSSLEFTPERHHFLQALDKLAYFECTMCRATYPKERMIQVNQPGPIEPASNPEYLGNFQRAVRARRPALFYLFQLAEIRQDERVYTHDKRFICKDCCSIFSALLPTK